MKNLIKAIAVVLAIIAGSFIVLYAFTAYPQIFMGLILLLVLIIVIWQLKEHFDENH